MKTILFLVILLSIQAQAGFQKCPQDWVAKYQKPFSLLQKSQGTTQIGDCSMEVHLCDPSMEGSKDLQLGDVLITYKGKEFYFPLYVGQQSGNTYSELEIGESIIFYDFTDENRDRISGKRERDALTIIFNFAHTRIDEIRISKNRASHIGKKNLLARPSFVVCRSPERENQRKKQSN